MGWTNHPSPILFHARLVVPKGRPAYCLKSHKQFPSELFSQPQSPSAHTVTYKDSAGFWPLLSPEGLKASSVGQKGIRSPTILPSQPPLCPAKNPFSPAKAASPLLPEAIILSFTFKAGL